MRAGRLAGQRVRSDWSTARRAELGEIAPETIVPISEKPEDLSIIVAGGAGSHSVFVPVSAHTRSVTQEVVLSE